MKKDEWTLSKELGRLRKYGLNLNAVRIKENEIYNIVFEDDRKVFEPSCTVEEIIGIINALEQFSEMLIEKRKRKILDGAK